LVLDTGRAGDIEHTARLRRGGLRKSDGPRQCSGKADRGENFAFHFNPFDDACLHPWEALFDAQREQRPLKVSCARAGAQIL
jgi:hypothetical protein